jgi:Fe-S-cluster containining protein
VDDSFPACQRWEPALDCRACAACCREGFDSVSLAMREPVVWRHPQLVVRAGHRFKLLRDGGRCAALAERAGGFTCAIYADRPRACHELTAGGSRCLAARRRLGLS